jgi:hypothetical protein
LIEVEEAAERLEELIDLALRQDEVFLCRNGRALARLIAFSGGDGLTSDKTADVVPSPIDPSEAASC